jgi:hypothetical protein
MLESDLLESAGLARADLEPLADNCSKVGLGHAGLLVCCLMGLSYAAST